MFARNVTMHLKPNCEREYTNTLENEIIPMLRKQNGFQDELSFILPNGNEAIGISLWNTRKDAENYERTMYKKVVTALSAVIDGTPEVTTYEVTNSTPHGFVRR